MTETIRFEGLQSIIALFPTLEKQIKAEAKKAIAASAILVQNSVKDEMRKRKGGKTYRRGAFKRNGKGKATAFKYHRASAPGEAPAVDTGRLINSINHSLSENGLTALIGVMDLSHVKYAKMLEYGTRKIQPRPYLIPALLKNKKAIEARFNEALNRAMKADSK